MTGGLGWRRFALALALVSAGSACTPAIFARGGRAPVLTRRGPDAFQVLAQVGYSFRALRCGHYEHDREAEAHVVVDDAAYAALYRDWKLCWERPKVDFSRHVVVAFLVPAAGCEGELVGFELTSDGRLKPQLHWLGDMCNMIEVYHRVIAAIPRSALPADGVHLDVEDASASARWSRAASEVRAPLAAAGEVAPRANETPIGRVAIPPRGHARLERLGQESLVWVVHTGGGELSIVSAWARTPELSEAPDQLNVAGIGSPVVWDPRDGRFYGGWSIYDPRGINVLGVHLPDLDVFRYRVEGGSLAVFGPGAPARVRDVIDPAPSQQARQPTAAFAGLFPEPALSLQDALRVPVGSWVTIDADVVRLGADPRVRLCRLAEHGHRRLEACARHGVWVEDARILASVPNPHADDGLYWSALGAQPEVSAIAGGPVRARRTQQGFADVRLLRRWLAIVGGQP
jgi:hypothetical protein